ncbi:MAG: UDP-2,4-diacetamido-2,4,6-trideoxy-beta-L-altropyranose hydrolase [Mariprofundaceae bacterium]|nr:UDP-2,4-diacetamido-2,4,6-trideoxy-beta-L-altropyranose hydrolase [Mariprofundaceae bacterium]
MNFDILFRADASCKIGVGHVIRCLTLADALTELGWRCHFAVMPDTLNILPALAQSPYEIIQLNDQSELQDLEDHFKSGVKLLVVDHYDWSAAQESECRKWAERIFVIDDLANRPHDCDVLLDQALDRSDDDYSSLVPSPCPVLLGPSFSLLRPQFAKNVNAAKIKRKQNKSIQNILITLGGVAPIHLIEMVLDALQKADCKVEVDLVLGTKSEISPSIISKVENLTFQVNLLSAVKNVSDLMLKADLSIGTVGSTSWERCCLGLPAVVIATAENQMQNARSLHQYGAIEFLGKSESLSSSDIANVLKKLLHNNKVCLRMSNAAFALCDGIGAQRVSSLIFSQELASDGQSVRLMPATYDDLDLIYKWQKHPNTRRYARNSEIPTYEEHVSWMSDTLLSRERLIWIIEHAGEPAGVLRLDQHKHDDECEVSIFIAPNKIRMGISVAALRAVRQNIGNVSITAEILPENTASQKLFLKAGYKSKDGRHFTCPPTEQ